MKDLYQGDGRIVQYLGSHLVHRLIVPRDTDVSHKTLQRSPLQGRYCLWFGRGHCSLEASLTSFVEDSARPSQLFYVVMMHWELVYWHPLFGTLRKGPSLESFGTRVEDFVDVGTVQVGRKRDVEGQVDYGISRGQR